ncbi:antibiotic biosynthesis monooxygenase [Karstenula rhodostoma CBS 690.94]|uniref:Antibiotic biosynthesis monooxygenase n=1 Tax=Karstenula rhodostoma CBS 690.94 TaxID=1392251 RepID=A0A9P4U9T0_9PLEO|nr:antibiotic biosynthesis monooxygenase [Karstenula rhodostoma CBS 690.94]
MPPLHVQLDRSTTFVEQLSHQPTSGPIVLINVISIPPKANVESFLHTWRQSAEVLKAAPGYISTQLHRGIGDGNFLINYAVWESNETLKNGLNLPAFRKVCEEFPEGTEFRASVVEKLAVDGVCVGVPLA